MALIVLAKNFFRHHGGPDADFAAASVSLADDSLARDAIKSKRAR